MFRIDCKYAHKPLRKGRTDWMSCFDTCTNCDGPAISDAVHARFLSLHPAGCHFMTTNTQFVSSLVIFDIT